MRSINALDRGLVKPSQGKHGDADASTASGAHELVPELELADRVDQPFRLLAETRRGRGAFFDQRRVLLRHLVELRHRAADQADTLFLFLRGVADLADEFVDAPDLRDDVGHRATRGVHLPTASLDLFCAVRDQMLDLARGLCRALRQQAHLAGDHREAAALFAGACRLDRGVERKNVGLEGDAVDHADDVGDLAAGRRDRFHRVHHRTHGGAAPGGDVACRTGRPLGLHRGGRVVVDGRTELLHGGSRLLQVGGLCLRTLAQVALPVATWLEPVAIDS